MQAREVMSHPVVTVTTSTMRPRRRLMCTHGFTALPVVDDDDRLVGIVTEADLIRDRIPAGSAAAPRVATAAGPGNRRDGPRRAP